MRSTKEILKELEQLWFLEFPYTKALFLSPYVEKELQNFSKKVKRELPQEFIDLYTWKGGTEQPFFAEIHLFLDMELLKYHCEEIDDLESPILTNHKKQLLPFLADVEGAHVLTIDTAGELSGKKNSIVQISYQTDKHYIVYKSLNHFLEMLLIKSKNGLYKYKEKTSLSADGSPYAYECNIETDWHWKSGNPLFYSDEEMSSNGDFPKELVS